MIVLVKDVKICRHGYIFRNMIGGQSYILNLIANPKFKSWTDSNVYQLRIERDSIEAKSTPVKHTNVAFG